MNIPGDLQISPHWHELLTSMRLNENTLLSLKDVLLRLKPLTFSSHLSLEANNVYICVSAFFLWKLYFLK